MTTTRSPKRINITDTVNIQMIDELAEQLEDSVCGRARERVDLICWTGILPYVWGSLSLPIVLEIKKEYPISEEFG